MGSLIHPTNQAKVLAGLHQVAAAVKVVEVPKKIANRINYLKDGDLQQQGKAHVQKDDTKIDRKRRGPAVGRITTRNSLQNVTTKAAEATEIVGTMKMKWMKHRGQSRGIIIIRIIIRSTTGTMIGMLGRRSTQNLPPRHHDEMCMINAMATTGEIEGRRGDMIGRSGMNGITEEITIIITATKRSTIGETITITVRTPTTEAITTDPLPRHAVHEGTPGTTVATETMTPGSSTTGITILRAGAILKTIVTPGTERNTARGPGRDRTGMGTMGTLGDLRVGEIGVPGARGVGEGNITAIVGRDDENIAIP